MTNYKIIDNFLEEEDFKQIESVILNPLMPWYYGGAVGNFTENNDDYYFTHMLYNGVTPQSDLFYIVSPILDKLKIKALMRVKVNMYPNINKFNVHEKHTDYPDMHKGAIFYLNTNNGYTILEDNTKIESVRNRILLFDPSTSHSSTNCTDQKTRLNINFNYF